MNRSLKKQVDSRSFALLAPWESKGGHMLTWKSSQPHFFHTRGSVTHSEKKGLSTRFYMHELINPITD